MRAFVDISFLLTWTLVGVEFTTVNARWQLQNGTGPLNRSTLEGIFSGLFLGVSANRSHCCFTFYLNLMPGISLSNTLISASVISQVFDKKTLYILLGVFLTAFSHHSTLNLRGGDLIEKKITLKCCPGPLG